MSDESIPGSRRPTTWLVFGILNIVFGSWGILAGLWQVLHVLVQPAFLKEQNDANPVFQDPSLLIWTQATAAFSIPFSIFQIVIGIWLIRFLAKGRGAAIVYSWLDIVIKLISGAVTVMIMPEVMKQAVKDTGGTPVTADGSLMGGAIIIGVVFGILISLIFPILQLIFLRRRALPSAAVVDERDQPVGDDPENPYQAPGRR